MKKLLQLSTLLFFFLLSNLIAAQAPSGYTRIENHDFGSNREIKSLNQLTNKFTWGIDRADNHHYPFSSDGAWQKYTSFTSGNYAIAEDHLQLIAKFNNDLNGNGVPDHPHLGKGTTQNREITSGMIRSNDTYKPTASKSYYFEARMKIPTGKAMFPAFWIFRDKGGNSMSEIDIIEVVNNNADSDGAPNWRPKAYHTNAWYENRWALAAAGKKKIWDLEQLIQAY